MKTFNMIVLLLLAILIIVLATQPTTLSTVVSKVTSVAKSTIVNDGRSLNANLISATSMYDIHHPWCIWQEDFLFNRYSIVISDDGSNTVAGHDQAGQCAEKLREGLKKKGATITDWSGFYSRLTRSKWDMLTVSRHCHYGPENSVCVIFTLPKLVAHLKRYIYNTCHDAYDLYLDCNGVYENCVCPSLFPN